MARYIDADKLMELSQDVSTFDYVTKSFGCFSGVSDEDIAKTTTADVAEVVRCKDCKHLEKDEGLREGRMCLIRGKAGWCHDNDFCSYGEKK